MYINIWSKDPEKMRGVYFCVFHGRQDDAKIGSGLDLGERYLDGIEVRLEWPGRFLADLAHT